MKKVILYCWQLPQNIIGLLYSIFSGSSKEHSIKEVDKIGRASFRERG